jgi:hypothetical protein
MSPKILAEHFTAFRYTTVITTAVPVFIPPVIITIHIRIQDLCFTGHQALHAQGLPLIKIPICSKELGVITQP